jgi:hypothetical protein
MIRDFLNIEGCGECYGESFSLFPFCIMEDTNGEFIEMKNSVPVVYMSIRWDHSTTLELMEGQLRETIRLTIERYKDLFPNLNSGFKKIGEAFDGSVINFGLVFVFFSLGLRALFEMLHDKYKKKIILLIDHFDTNPRVFVDCSKTDRIIGVFNAFTTMILNNEHLQKVLFARMNSCLSRSMCIRLTAIYRNILMSHWKNTMTMKFATSSSSRASLKD